MRVVPSLLLSALCALLLVLVVSPATATATATQFEIDSAIAKALAFAPTQHDPATGEPPGHERTGFYSGEWLASGYAAAGLSAADVRAAANPSFQDFLFNDEMAGFWDAPFPIAPEYTGRLILVAHAAGIDTARVSATQNLPARMIEALKPAAGGFGEPNTFSTAWGTLALESTSMPQWSLAPMLAYLRGDQHADGGWSFYRVGEGEGSNPDITAAAIGALCGGGVPAYDPTVSDGLAYLRGLLVDETGAVEHPEFGPNVDSASFTVNALNACGIDPQSSAWTTADGKTPIDYILSLQDAEGGFAFFAGEPWFPSSTGHALRALAGRGFVVGPAPRQDLAQPTVRPVPTVAAGTPVPHVLAIELAPGNVRLCRVPAPVGAPLTEVLAAAKSGSQPAGCVNSFSASAGEVTEVDGVAPEGDDEAWLARLDRGAAAIAGEQPVGFGDTISLWRGPRPPAATPDASAGSSRQPGPAGQPGPRGRRGKRGAHGKPGRNASIVCKVRHRRAGKPKVRCTVKHGRVRGALAVRAPGFKAFAVGGEEGGRKGLPAWRVAGGDGEAADEVGVDAFAPLAAACDRAEQVAEPDGGVATGVIARFGVERGRGFQHRFADPRQVAAGLVAGQAFADQGFVFQQHFFRRRLQRSLVGTATFEAGDRRRFVRVAAADEGGGKRGD